MQYQTLENCEITELHKTFIEAFSDYQVPMKISLEDFEKMLSREGVNLCVSVGAFDDNKLVGFILNGCRMWEGELTIYDAGTGVIPSHRKQGVTTALLELMKSICSENNIHSYLLEVLQENQNALSLYKKQGFEIVRSFDCFQKKEVQFIENTNFEIIHPATLSNEIFNEVKSFWDYTPSWQNSIDTIQTNPNNYVYSLVMLEHRIIGYGVIGKRNGSLLHIAVNKSFRKQGVATAILNDLIAQTDCQKMSIINVDTRNIELIHFLEKNGFIKFVSQYEMKKTI